MFIEIHPYLRYFCFPDVKQSNVQRPGYLQCFSYGYYDWLFTKLPEMGNSIMAMKSMQLANDKSRLDRKMASVTGSEIIESKLVVSPHDEPLLSPAGTPTII